MLARQTFASSSSSSSSSTALTRRALYSTAATTTLNSAASWRRSIASGGAHCALLNNVAKELRVAEPANCHAPPTTPTSILSCRIGTRGFAQYRTELRSQRHCHPATSLNTLRTPSFSRAKSIKHPDSNAAHTAGDSSKSSSSAPRQAHRTEAVHQGPGVDQGPSFPARAARPFAAAQPPPRQHGAPRLIRYPPPESEAHQAQPPPPPTTQPAALYKYSRGSSSRLFSYRNAATAASTTQRALPSGRSPHTFYWPSPSSTTAISSSYEPVLDENGKIPASIPATTADTNASMSAHASARATGIDAGAGSESLTARSKGNTDPGLASMGSTASTVSQSTHDHDHDHAGHAHGWFGGHSHSHSHGAEGSAEDADKLLAALKGKGDRGSNITVVGLIANLVLCGAKGVAGVLLHSASLLADAAHSLSDTFSDLVTLFCWKMSQKPASISHPLGYGKFETMGGLGVSLVLVAGSFAIGMHSYGLLLEVLQPHLQQMPAGFQALSSLTGDIARAAGGMLHDHTHSAAAPLATSDAAGSILNAAEKAKAGTVGLAQADHGVLDPNAMWFALISILVKEWLYRATLKIAREENSSVLEANAIHHRSDSLSSGVTFLAIGGSYLGFPVLDPLGGLLVAGLIGKQGAELLIGALNDLSDRGVQPEVLDDFENVLRGIMDEPAASSSDANSARLLGWKDLRAVRSGVSTFVDVTLLLAADTPLKRAQVVESRVREAITAAHKGVKEVRVRLEPQQ